MNRYFNIFSKKEHLNHSKGRFNYYIRYWVFGIIIVSIMIMVIQIIYNYDASTKCTLFKDSINLDPLLNLSDNLPKPFINLA